MANTKALRELDDIVKLIPHLEHQYCQVNCPRYQAKAKIEALIAEAEKAAKISETQYWFDLALTEDADAVLMNSLRRQFRNRLAQLQGEEQ